MRTRFQAVIRRIIHRRALTVMLALSAYKHEHGEYPERLDALVPGYLAEIPADAYTAEPFKYERKSADDYELGPPRPVSDNLSPSWQSVTLEYEPDSYLPER